MHNALNAKATQHKEAIMWTKEKTENQANQADAMTVFDHENSKVVELPLNENQAQLAALAPGQSCQVTVPFQPLTAGNYTIRVELTHSEAGEPLVLESSTAVESSIEAELALGVVMLAYVLIRVSLQFTLE